MADLDREFGAERLRELPRPRSARDAGFVVRFAARSETAKSSIPVGKHLRVETSPSATRTSNWELRPLRRSEPTA